MRLLLDTHALIWWDEGTGLKKSAQKAIRDADQVFVSAASAWEIAIKASLGRIDPRRSFAEAIEENGFEELPVMVRHATAVSHLPWHHRDPFDRLLIAQARVDRLTIVTRDPAFAAYGTPTLPA